MILRVAAASDPLFYLHHGNVDRQWWSWQSRDLSKRLTDVNGPLVPFDYGNQQGGNSTLNSVLDFTQLAPSVKVGSVVDIRKLCYTYDKLS